MLVSYVSPYSFMQTSLKCSRSTSALQHRHPELLGLVRPSCGSVQGRHLSALPRDTRAERSKHIFLNPDVELPEVPQHLQEVPHFCWRKQHGSGFQPLWQQAAECVGIFSAPLPAPKDCLQSSFLHRDVNTCLMHGDLTW